MTVNISPLGGAAVQFFNDNGVPLSGGKLYTYAAGTTTPETTYTTSAGNVAHSNPIVLDAAGRVPSGGEIWLTVGVGYKFVVKTSTDVTVGTYDNILNGVTSASLVEFTGFNGQTGTVQDLADDDGADWIGYTAPGTTPQAFSVQDALQNLDTNLIFLSRQVGTTGDEKFTNALLLMQANPSAKIIVDDNFDILDNYVIDYYVNIEGSVANTSLQFQGTGTFLTLSTAAASGSVLRNLSLSANADVYFNNFFNGRTILKLQSTDPNNTGDTPINVLVDNCKFEWCETAISLEAAVSCSFNDIRIQNALYGIFLTGGACLENSFLRPNILAARHAVQFARYSATPDAGAGQVPQGNYFVNGTIVTQYGDELRTNGGYSDATIDSVCATVKGNCAFDYAFANCWIENNIKATGSSVERLGFAVDFQQSYDKSYLGAMRFTGCKIYGTKIRISGGTAAAYSESGVTGTMFVGNDIVFYTNPSGRQEFYVGDYLANVIIKSNNFWVVASDKKCITFYHVRDSVFSENNVLYENNTFVAWPTGPSVCYEEPFVLADCERVIVKNNNFDYLTLANLDFIDLQGTNTDCIIQGNDCPLSGKITTVGPCKFFREQERVTCVLRTNTESYANGDVIAAVPAYLQIQNANALEIANAQEVPIAGNNVGSNSLRFAYQDGNIEFISNSVPSVNYMRGVLYYSIF